MSEQATFIRSVPPVAGPESTSQAPVDPTVADPSTTSSTEGVATTAQADVELTISGFQNAVYLSILASICIFGFAAVLTVQRGLARSKVLKPIFIGVGVVFIALALHAFITSRLFAGYLNGEVSDASLFYRMGGWILFAPALAWLRASLYQMNKGKDVVAQVIDAILFGVVFLAAAIGLQSGINPTFSIVFALVALCIYAVIVARSFGIKAAAIERNPHLAENPYPLLWAALIYGPAIFPLLALFRSIGMGHDTLHLLLTLGEVVVVIAIAAGLFMLSVQDGDGVDAYEGADGEVEADEAPRPQARSGGIAKPAPVDVDDPFGPVPTAGTANHSAPKPAKKTVIISRHSNGSGKAAIVPSQDSGNDSQPSAKPAPQKAPPPKPPAPKAPGPGAPRAIKAPQKPKRRF